MKRKHVVFFSIVVLVSIAALIVFQMFGDGGYLGGLPPEPAIDGPAAPAPVDAGP